MSPDHRPVGLQGAKQHGIVKSLSSNIRALGFESHYGFLQTGSLNLSKLPFLTFEREVVTPSVLGLT